MSAAPPPEDVPIEVRKKDANRSFPEAASVAVAAHTSSDLYAQLGLSRDATDTEVRRAYRNLLTRAHPDKGGDPERFRRIQAAYDVLSEPTKRKLYDQTGRIQKTADQEFVERFANGAFNDPVLAAAAAAAGGGGGAGVSSGSLADQIIVRHNAGEAQSHTAGFEAWMRSRGDGAGNVFTAETVAEQYGVARQSYDPVLLPKADVLQVLCRGPGDRVADSLVLEAVPLASELEWGQVLVAVKYAPISAADTYTARLGGVYGSDTAPKLPYVAGHDGVGVVLKVGPGVKSLCEGDLVLPLRPFAGTWTSAAVWPERHLLRLPKDGWGLPLEYLSMSRELVVAYQLLEQGGLKPGDAVILNAASSTVGQTVLQLSKLLRLRAVAVVHRGRSSTRGRVEGGGISCAEGSGDNNIDGVDEAKWDRTAAWLRGLGAVEVLADEGSLRAELDRLRFFSRPRLALDAVGGDSALRLMDTLNEGGELVVYGCMSGRSPVFPWQSWVFKDVHVRGFNLRRWISGRPARLAEALEALGKLVAAGMLGVEFTEYDITEWREALEHAQERGKRTKVILRMTDPWVTGGDPVPPTITTSTPTAVPVPLVTSNMETAVNGEGGMLPGFSASGPAPVDNPAAARASQAPSVARPKGLKTGSFPARNTPRPVVVSTTAELRAY
ncbi:molecular chaperone [Volvox carteri f. nagariensis]|uniref:enoyl-[acyl-carrier-protein] reductase n=1 Tax=Volvox carteri f. nagariensis TaxID=3068 RepID=D8UAD2_VOLCA|nr:molecular chaperone [Volvox carteri f. nagariensis]EFJ43248.1 molecular chaperone [Volvox carteri f. nagariensis]|eukprot:XP_002955608.1 molecular chaperone [Volvox carteri f. nagariensis]